MGAPGTAVGVTAADAADAVLLPLELVATTVKVYGWPMGIPRTMHAGVAEVQV